MGKDTNGNESGEGMVFGWNTVLRRSGVCTGKDTGIKQTGREIAVLLLGVKNKPGYGQKKEGGYAQNEKLKPSYGRCRKHLTKPSAFESEIHHRTNQRFVLRIFRPAGSYCRRKR